MKLSAPIFILKQQAKALSRQRQLIIVCLSQIDRRFDRSFRPCPGIDDVRQPNPVDLGLFSKTCFLHEGEMVFTATRAGSTNMR
jgi:hypothetical protein